MRLSGSLSLYFLALLTVAAAAQAQQAPVREPSDVPASRPVRPGEPVYQQQVEEALRKLSQVYSILENEAADPVTPEKQIYQGAIPGMLRSLDPYSVFFDAEQFRTLQQHQQAKSEGFGTIVSIMPGRVIVLQSFQGSPAAKAGIEPGDEILGVNGIRLDRLSVDEIVQVLSEARQQKTQMYVLRPNSSRVDSITATPAELSEASVDRAFFVKKGVGYLHVASFEMNTAEEVKQALEKWGVELHALVLDLRDNHGGLVNAAVQTAGLFMPNGTLVLTARDRNSEQKRFTVETADPAGQRLPLVVLVGPKTASAAEILASALQDAGRAPLVGLRTFGKGTVQTVYPLSAGTGLALATGRYVTPSGRYIERTRTAQGGIDPDFAVAPHNYSDLQYFLEARSLFLEFARKLKGEGRTISENFEVTPALMDEFRSFLNDLQIPVNQKIWSENAAFIRARLKIDILNLAFGVARGDQAAAESDPQVQRALEVLSTKLAKR